MKRKTKKKRQKPLKGHIVELSLSSRIFVKMRTERGRVIKFSVTYSHKIKKKWRSIRRCDNSHGVVDYHIFRYNGKNKTIRISGELDYLLIKSIKDFKKHHKSYLDYYLKK